MALRTFGIRRAKRVISIISLFAVSIISFYRLYQSQVAPLLESPVVPIETPVSQLSPSPTARVLGVTTTDFEEVLVTKVIDGDTLQLEDGRKLRLIGVDTPETKHPKKPVGCYGTEASKKTSELLLNKRIRLEKDVSETDRYGRLLRYVYLDDVMINEQLVATGYAFAASFPPDIKYQAIFSAAEKQAREQQLGLWGNCQVK